MIPLFAHHVELQHVPVLAAFLAVGFWLGWHSVSKVLARRAETHSHTEVGP